MRRLMNELTCPYCNAVVPLTGSVTAGQTLTCPRCEERFKALGDVKIAPSIPLLSPAPLAPARRLSNRALALTVVGVMLLMAAGTTIFALLTEKERRENDKGLKHSRTWKRPPQLELEEPEPVSPVAPRDLDALQLLPGDLDVLAGVHVALVLQEKEGQR